MHTLIAFLPPPIEDTPEATLVRNHAAIARIAALAPVNASEAELAAQCISSRAQAEDMLRLIRLHADDIDIVIKLNAQYAAMIRASLAAHNRLIREQQQRRKRETARGAADQDESTRHIAARAMLKALPTEPKADTVSHKQKNETPMGQSAPDIRDPGPAAQPAPAAGNHDSPGPAVWQAGGPLARPDQRLQTGT